jgi:hypothetical protein
MEDSKMKKVLAIALALALVLSMNVVAFADGPSVAKEEYHPSETGGGSTSNVPVEYVDYGRATGRVAGNAIVRHIEKDGTEDNNLTPEQEEQVNAVLEDAINAGNAVVEAIYVEVPPETTEANPVTIIIELKEGEKVLIYALDGSLQQTANREDLKNVEGDFYEITIPASCILVVAKQ